MNILVTGANGQLGREIRLMAKGRDDRFVFTDVTDVEGLETERLDITSMDDVRAAVKRHSADAIVNCAAYTNVEAAEDNYDLAELLNAGAPANLARAMKEAGGLLVHVSTDYVFGGESYNAPCKEDMKGSPTGVYGLTKLHGEEAVRSSGCSYVILRTAWLYSEYGKNFVKTMLDLTSSRPAIQVVFDQAGTPTYALDLARAILAVLDDYKVEPRGEVYSKSGIYHYSNEGVCSWYDFAVAVSSMAGHDSCTVLPCHSSDFPSRVVRPAYSVLDKTLVKQTFGVSIPYWMDSLRTCLNNILKEKAQ